MESLLGFFQAGINAAALLGSVLVNRSRAVNRQLWGVMTIFLPTARTSTRSPSFKPTAERTLLGMVIWPLGRTLTRVLIRF